ncbi:hypothetical protein K8I85_01140, partial [bacterium]|nr:hypothetical protein [bacterium]
MHPDPWFHATRAEVTAAADELSTRLPELTRDESLAGFFRIVAMLRDGHTSIGNHHDPGVKRVQLLYRLFPDGLHVMTVHPDHAAVLGGRVLRIGNVSAEEAYARIEPLVPVDNEWTLRDRTP